MFIKGNVTAILFIGEILSDRRAYHMSIYAHSRTRYEEYLDNQLIVTRRRSAPLLKCFKSNSRVVDRSVYLQTAAMWNSMDIDTRKIDNPTNFKSLQKKKLMDSVPPIVVN